MTFYLSLSLQFKTALKKNSTLKSAFIIALHFLSLFTLHGQDHNIPVAYRERVNRLFDKVQKDFFTLPIGDLPCPIQSNINDTPLDSWWLKLHQLRDNGDKDCCFKVLNALEPIVKNDKTAYLQWLLEKTQTLNKFQSKDSSLITAKELRILADKYGQLQGWAALVEAQAHRAKRKFDVTIPLAEEALSYARKDKDRRLEEAALNLLGVAFRDIYINRPEKCVPFIEKALHIAEELKDTSAIITELFSIGLSYDETADTERLLDYTEGAIALLKPTASLNDRMMCLRLLTIYLQNKKDFNRALPLYLHIITLMKKLGRSGLVQNTYEQVADLYYRQKQYDKALAMMDSASVYSDFKSELGYFYRTYADIYHAKGDATNAVKYYQMAFDEQVKGYTNRNSSLLTEMETRFRTRETEILLEQQTKQRWMLFGLVALLLVLTVGAVYAYLRKKKANKEIEAQSLLIKKQASELRHLDEAKTRFFANVSHELRTPLTLILGPIASMLKRNRLENTDFTYAKTAQTHAQDLLKLVNEILDLSKIESGKMRVHEETVSLQPFMRRLVSAFESHAERLGIHYQFEYQAGKRLRLMLDTEKLTRIVNNLLSNAMKFTPKGGTITVAVEDLANMIRLTVTDTGRGIHPDDLPSVFDRFYQTNQVDAPVEGGTGIGLALCREFTEVLKGRIWVESEWGKGSQFYFEFPKKEVLGVGEPNELGIVNELDIEQDTEGGITDSRNLKDGVNLTSNPTPNPTPSPNTNTTLLVVEDNPDLRTYISSILRGANYKVLEAEHGMEALDILSVAQNQQSDSVKLIISDIMMPVMDGFQLLKVLKDRDYFKGIPVVMLTARADIRDKLTALRIGVDDYLLKPFEEEELLARVENLLRNYQNRMVNDEYTEGDTLGSGNFESSPNLVTPLHPQRPNDQSEWLAELEKVVSETMAQFDFNTEGVAEKMFMGRSQFFKKVKQLTGITPNEYVQEMRLAQARTLLESRRVTTVKEAALSVGFKDVRYFSELFKKRFGKLPSDYLA